MPSHGQIIAATQHEEMREKEEVEKRFHEKIVYSLICFLSDESNEGLENIKEAIIGAGKQYNAEGYHWVLSSILTYYHGRKIEAKNTERDIVSYPDVLTRFQTLAKIFLKPNGGWESTSYNSLLLIHFMRAIDQVADDSNDPMYFGIIVKIKDLFKQQLQARLHDLSFSQSQAEEVAQNVKAVSEKAKRQAIDSSKLFYNKMDASQYAIEQPEKVVFYLAQKDQSWQLKWYDLYGSPVKLDVSEELEGLLSSADQDESQIKLECLKLRDLLIEERKVLINPAAPDLSGLKSSFVLKGEPQDYSLDWYDTNGHYREIHLKNYIQLSQFLEQHSDFETMNVDALERHLRRVSVNEKENIFETIQALDKFFSRKSSNEQEVTIGPRCLVNPAASDLANLESVFVLNTTSDEIKLQWYGAFGIQGPDIELGAYPELNRWIHAQENIQADNEELIRLLSQVDTTKKIDRSALKAMLAEKITSRLSVNLDVSQSELPVPPTEQPSQAEFRRLDLSQFEKVATLFGHKPTPRAEDSEHKTIVPNP